MALISTQTLAANGRVYFRWNKSRESRPYEVTVAVYGSSFGGGTVTLQASPDNGTTWIDLPNPAGSATTFTANGWADIRLAGSSDPVSGEQILVGANLAGATSPSITFKVWDNR